MDTIYNRLLLLRKTLRLTQLSFSQMLGLSQSQYNAIENGKSPLNDRILKLVKSTVWPNGKYVNINWLNGEDDQEMFKDLDPDLELMNAVGKISEDEDELIKTILLEYSKLDEEDKMKVCKFIFSISDSARASYQKIIDKQKKEKD